MATTRGSASSYDVGNRPPTVKWTFVRGDSASFKVYVTDDAKQALTLDDWNIDVQIKRPTNSADSGIITDVATLILSLSPTQDVSDAPGEFKVSLASSETQILETGDIFDIQLSEKLGPTVWTVAQGSVVVLEDVTE